MFNTDWLASATPCGVSALAKGLVRRLVAIVFLAALLVAQLAKEFLVYPVKADFVQLNLFERVNTLAFVAFDFVWVHWNWWLV